MTCDSLSSPVAWLRNPSDELAGDFALTGPSMSTAALKPSDGDGGDNEDGVHGDRSDIASAGTIESAIPETIIEVVIPVDAPIVPEVVVPERIVGHRASAQPACRSRAALDPERPGLPRLSLSRC